MTRRPRALTLLAALLALLSPLATGCQRPEPDPPTATLDPTTEPKPESPSDPQSDPEPTDSPDPATYAIPENPEDLNAEYFERVLQALYDIEDEAYRRMLVTEEVGEEARSLLQAIYHPEIVDSEIANAETAAREGFPDLRRPPGSQDVTVDRVISADESCAFVAGLRDFANVLANPRDRSGEEDFIMLLRPEPDRDPEINNPTPWVIGGSVLRSDGSQPGDPCRP